MARFNKIQTLQAIIQTGMVPVYYNKEVEPSSLLTGEISPTRYLASW